MAAENGRRARVRDGFIPDADRGITAKGFEPGRLHAQLSVLPHRHDAPVRNPTREIVGQGCWRAMRWASGRAGRLTFAALR